MKKATFFLFLVFLLLAFFLAGTAIGRNSRADRVTITYAAPAAATNPAPAEESVHATQPSQADTAPVHTAEKININTAGVDELDQLPGIGAVLAQRIVEYREANGPFSSLEALLNVSGIGEKKLESLRDFASVGGVQ